MSATEEREVLYGLDEPHVLLPREMAATLSQARYRGWRELDSLGMTEDPFDPSCIVAKPCWIYRVTDNPYDELTHRANGDAMTPGAYEGWFVLVCPTRTDAARSAAPKNAGTA